MFVIDTFSNKLILCHPIRIVIMLVISSQPRMPRTIH